MAVFFFFFNFIILYLAVLGHDSCLGSVFCLIILAFSLARLSRQRLDGVFLLTVHSAEWINEC